MTTVGLISMLSSCDVEKDKNDFTMARDSELTLLMRDMYNYYDSLKVHIKADTLPQSQRIFHEIHTAVATSPDKSSSEVYQGLATIYHNSAKRIYEENVDRKMLFNQMVDNCMSCHQQMCPGPMIRIKKLYID